MKTLKFGILGCGMIANIHAEAIKNVEGAELIGAADARRESTEKFAEKYGVKAYSSFEEMLADKEIGAVCVCTPSFLHAENAIQALKAGKHVALEKPMALNTADADEIIRTCEETGKKLTVISQLRFSDDINKVKKLVEEGAFGKITLGDLYMKYYRSEEYYSSSAWKGKLAFDGGGALMNQGIHGVDLLTYILGDVKKVSGEIRTLSHKIEVEDTAAAVVEFESGALGVIEASTCAYPGFDRKIERHGDKGYAVIKEDKIERLMINGKKSGTEEEKAKAATSSDPSALSCALHARQLGNFVKAIDGKEKLVIDAEEGRKAVAIIRKIYGDEQ